MYETFFGLRELPFGSNPDPRYLLLTSVHTEALSTLQHGMSSRTGIVLMTGDAGTGKTTLLTAAIASQTEPQRAVTIDNPVMTRHEFVEYVASQFGLSAAAARSKAQLLVELRALAEQHAQDGGHTILAIDEAHAAPDDVLEEIRLLGNIQTPTHRLLTVILAGQSELAVRLNAASLRQLKQRIELRCTLRPLEFSETEAYIVSRVRQAGGDAARMFTMRAIAEIHEASGGIPRTISVICHNALIAGLAVNQKPVPRTLVVEVCRDLELATPTTGVPTTDRKATAAASPSPALVPVAAALPEKERTVPIVSEPAQSMFRMSERQGPAWFRLRRGAHGTNR
jgi:general secretion pathway protein A